MYKRIKEPNRVERLTRALCYFFFGLVGISMMIMSPMVLEPDIAVAAIGWGFFLLSGLFSAHATWRGNYKHEFIWLYFITGTLMVYTLFLVVVVATGSIYSLPAVFLSAAITLKMVSRMIYLYKLVRTERGSVHGMGNHNIANR